MADPYGLSDAGRVWSDPMNVETRRRLVQQAIRDGADPNDFPDVDAPAEGELPALDGSSDWSSGQSPLDVAAAAPTMGAQPQAAGGLDALLEQRRKSVAEMYDAAAAKLQAAYRGPSTQDILLALGAGMLQPTRSGGFGEAVGNSLSAMLPVLQERNKFRNTVAEKIAGLDMQKARDLGDLEEKYLAARLKAPPRPRVAWSDNLGRTIPLDEVVVIEAGTLNGRPTEKMSDGSIRVYSGPNSFTVYDAGGRAVGQGTR